MYAKLKKANEGFTIVETLIVLTIAAVIITIVLIAVPDLQRTSRNTEIHDDAQNVASAIQTFEGNNNGETPNSVSSPVNSVVTISNTDSGASNATSSAHVKTSDTINTTSGAVAVSWGTGTTQVSKGMILVDFGADCGTTGSTNTTTADSRAVAVLYPIESSSSSNGSVACIQE